MGAPISLYLIHLSAENSRPHAAIKNFSNCTFKFSSSDPLEALFSDMSGVLVENLLRRSIGSAVCRGIKSIQLSDSSSIFAIGGQTGTVYLNLPGVACALITD